MKLYLRLGLILLAFCVVATALLAYVNSITKPKIDANKSLAAEQARSGLIPNAEFSPVTIKTDKDSIVYYVATDKASKEIRGYTFTAAKNGYSSNVKTMAALDKDFKLIAIKVIEQAETPGLGANCTTDTTFVNQFRGLATADLVVDKDGGKKVRSITGATITSRAVTNSLREMVDIVKSDVEARQANPAQGVTQ